MRHADFQIKQHKAAQQTIVENQINHEVFLIKGKTYLSADECEASTQFQQKLLYFLPVLTVGRFSNWVNTVSPI